MLPGSGAAFVVTNPDTSGEQPLGSAKLAPNRWALTWDPRILGYLVTVLA
jgi:hypothetical protein